MDSKKDKKTADRGLGGGLWRLGVLQRFASDQAEVILFDRQNHHLFQPLLYQVASAGLSAPDIARPIRQILKRRKNLTITLDEVVSFEVKHNRVRLRQDPMASDKVREEGSDRGWCGTRMPAPKAQIHRVLLTPDPRPDQQTLIELHDR